MVKEIALAISSAVLLIITFGSPFVQQPDRTRHFGAPAPILPMTFAHVDHTSVRCVTCHHNYVDATGAGLCMNCHVADPELWPLLESQFHDLCRTCHVEKQLAGEKSGPMRRCQACHLGDELP